MADVEERFFEGRRYARYPHAKNKNKRRYFVCLEWSKQQKRYVQRSLHRDVWESVHGSVPAGHHVHHKDNKWDKNDAEDLECLPSSAHRRLHGAEPEFKRITRDWHTTADGKRVRAMAVAAARQAREIKCAHCGKTAIMRSAKAMFCERDACRRERWRDRARKRRAGL